LLALPNSDTESNRYEFKIPYLGSLIASMSLSSKEVGLASFAKADRPPIAIPFFAFRIMVGCGLLMLAIAWVGSWAELAGNVDRWNMLLWATFLSFPLPFVATLTGWFTAEVGRQPWTVYGLMRTADAVTPHLAPEAALSSLIFFCVLYLLIFSFGTLYIYRLLSAGPLAVPAAAPANPKRPLALPGGSPAAETPATTSLS
jgi:cytochrome d ubiquinol oxidase subunit I